MSWVGSYRALNANVRIVLNLVFLWILTRELWESRQLPAYLYSVSHDSTAVGFASSISGIIQLLLSIPAGLYTDRFRRDTMIYASSGAGLIAIGLSAMAVHADSLRTLYVSMVFWGASNALNDSPIESLFADSTTTGNRARIFAIKHTMEQLGRTGGGLASAALFVLKGDSWNLDALKFLIMTGILLSLVPTCYQLLLSDDKSLKHQSEAAHLLEDTSQTQEQDDSGSDDDDDDDTERSPSATILRRVRYIVAAADLLTAIGSGAVIQFFPIFFIKEMEMTPIQLSLLFAFGPIANGVVALVGQRIGRRVGRSRTALILQLVGAVSLMLFSMATRVEYSIGLFLAQNALMSGIKPLKRSVLMDTVPKRKRGLWNAIESFTKMSWAGSAIIGGILSDQFGFRFTFLSCSILYLVSSLPFLYLDRRQIDVLIAAACRRHQ